MPLRALAWPQIPVCEAVTQFQRVLGWMKDFRSRVWSPARNSGRSEALTLNTSRPFRHRTAQMKWALYRGGYSDQVHLLLSLRLLRRQVRQFIEGA